MAAPVRVEAMAFSDPRIELLGQLGGFSRYEALGRMTYLWSACTERQLHVVPESVIRGCIGPDGVRLLLEADLAEEVEGGYRVRGTGGRIEWHAELQHKRARAGRARAEKARRGPDGCMLSDNSPACAGDVLSIEPAQSSALTSTSTLREETVASPPARDFRLEVVKAKADSEPKTPPAWKPAVDAFDSYFRATHGGAAPTWGAKQVAMLKPLVQKHGAAEVVRRIGVARSNPPKFPPQPWDLRTFIAHFDNCTGEVVATVTLLRTSEEL